MLDAVLSGFWPTFWVVFLYSLVFLFLSPEGRSRWILALCAVFSGTWLFGDVGLLLGSAFGAALMSYHSVSAIKSVSGKASQEAPLPEALAGRLSAEELEAMMPQWYHPASEAASATVSGVCQHRAKSRGLSRYPECV